MGDDGTYVSDDERVARYLTSLSPIASAGGDPDAPFQMQGVQSSPLKPGDPKNGFGMTAAERTGQVDLPNGGQVATTAGAGQNDPEYKPPPKPTQTAPASAPPTSGDPRQGWGVSAAPAGDPRKGWTDYYAKAGLEGQLRNTVAAENTAQYVANLPDGSATTRTLEATRARDAAAAPNPEDYKPSIGQRIFRGIKAGANGLVSGGVLGAAAGALNADYSAPTKQYAIASAKNAKTVASDDQQISVAQKSYQDATARAKANAVEQKATADEYGKLVTGADTAGKNEETARHNQAEEANTAKKNTDEAGYQTGELKVRNREVNVQAGRLSLEKKKQEFDEAQGNTPGGDESIRQPLIDKAAADLQAFKDGMTYNADTGKYQDTEAKKFMTPDQYIDQLNKFGADLDAKLVAKKQPPLGLRYKGGPKGQEIPIQTPPPEKPAPRKPQATVHSKQQVAVGDTVMYQGKPQVVKGFNAKGQIQFAP